MRDFADRTWCTKPDSPQWRDAWLKAFRAANPNLRPKVAIGSRYGEPRVFVRGL